jgi:hypothetical protein
MTRTRVLTACLTVAGVGMLAAVVRVLTQPSSALPRWDLLGCLALTTAGLAGALVCLRGGPVPRTGVAATTSRFWWPARNDGWIVAGLWAAVVPVGLFFYAVVSFSPDATRITEAKGGIQAASVQKILSSEYVRKKNSRHYDVVARVSVPFDAGARSEKVEFTSEHRLESGDKVWALYAPSSAELGVLVDTDREALEEKTGGSVQGSILAAVLGMAVFCLLLGIAFGGFSKASRGLRRPLKKGLCRSLPVTVKSVGVVMDSATNAGGRPRPLMKLEGGAGEPLEILLDPVIAPLHLSREVNGLQAKLYWGKYAADRPRPERVRAMLVLDGQRCVQGVLRAGADSGHPDGTAVPVAASLPEGDGLRAIRTYPAWDPRLHARGLWWLLMGVIALTGVAFGVGRWASFVLCAAACGAVLLARRAVKENRSRHLRGYVPGPEPETGR